MSYVFWGVFVVYGAILAGYLLWMYKIEKSEGGQ
jgi:hypothetical protein